MHVPVGNKKNETNCVQILAKTWIIHAGWEGRFSRDWFEIIKQNKHWNHTVFNSTYIYSDWSFCCIIEVWTKNVAFEALIAKRCFNGIFTLNKHKLNKYEVLLLKLVRIEY